MIHTLITVCLLCMGVGAKASTPININRQENQPLTTNSIKCEFKNKTNVQPYSDFNLTIAGQSHYLSTWDRGSGTDATLKEKTTYDVVRNDALTVKTIRYGQTKWGNYQQNTIPLGMATQNLKNYTNGLLQIQFTPSLQTVQNTLHLTIESSTIGEYHRSDYYDGGSPFIRTEYIIGTGEIIQNYFDFNDWTTNAVGYSYFNLVRQNDNTITYGNQDSILPIENTVQYFTQEFDIPIDYDSSNIKPTYFYALTYIIFPYSQTYTDYLNQIGSPNLSVGYVNNVDLGRGIIGFNPNTSTVTGTQINVNIDYEVVDIPGLMWEILSMPFSFISTAFNLTLFPGTPYQINIANLVLAIFGLMVFIFIFRIILKK